MYFTDPKDALKRPSVTRQNLEQIICEVKLAGRTGAELLLADLKKRFPPSVCLSTLAVLQPGFWFRNRDVADDEAGMAEFIKGAREKFDILMGRSGGSIVQSVASTSLQLFMPLMEMLSGFPGGADGGLHEVPHRCLPYQSRILEEQPAE